MSIIQSFITDDIKFTLYREGNVIKREQHHLQTGEKDTWVLLNPNNEPIGTRIAFYQKCQRILTNNGAYYSIAKSEFTLSRVCGYELIDVRLSLHTGYFGGEYELKATLFDHDTKVLKQLDLKDCLMPSLQCSAEVKAYFNFIKAMGSHIFWENFQKHFRLTKKFYVEGVTPTTSNIYLIRMELTRKLGEIEKGNTPIKGLAKAAGWGIFAVGAAAIPVIGLPLAGYSIYREAKTGIETMRENTLAPLLKTAITHLDEIKHKRREKILKRITKDIPFRLEFEPISESSRIDPRIRISRWRAAVTIVGHGGIGANHANIITEIFNEQSYEMWLSDFGDKGVRHRKLDHELKYDQRTRTWKVTMDKVKALFDLIIADEANPPKFAMLGGLEGDGVYNCFQWARKKLKDADIVDLDVKTFLDTGLLPWRLKNYTTLGNSVFRDWGKVGTYIGYPISPSVYMNNLADEYDFSPSTVSEREII